MTGTDVFFLVLMTAGSSAVAAFIGAKAIRRFRGRPLRTQTFVIALSSVFTLAAGALVAAKAMFISPHDVEALFVVMLVAAAVAGGAAAQLGRDIDAGARHVGALARSLVGEPPTTIGFAGGPGELAALADELHDVSRRLAEAKQRERVLEEARRELIAWVSHDLRSPLAAVRAMAEALDDKVVDDAETAARFHTQIRVDSERLTALVDDLFELSRIHSGSLRLHVERAPLRDIVADALSGARTQAHVKGVTIVDDVDSLPPVEVSAYELTRVLHNLLDNAIRHTPRGGSVLIESSVDETGALLSVMDECGGIPSTDLDRVFDVAFRGDTARANDGRGGGLGLAIAKGLVEAQDGSIEVANHTGGCRFTVRLPAPV